jgi:hypothetical protein
MTHEIIKSMLDTANVDYWQQLSRKLLGDRPDLKLSAAAMPFYFFFTRSTELVMDKTGNNISPPKVTCCLFVCHCLSMH